VNPITEHRRMPPGEPIPASLLDAFLAERDRLMATLPQASAGALVVSAAGTPQKTAPPSLH
jgi:hypothetical protein